MIGQRFGRWVVSSLGEPYLYPNGVDKALRYLCNCDCGVSKLVHSAHLKNGSSQSCGCLSREISSTHGLSKTRAYTSWSNMIRRCTGKSNSAKDESYVLKGISFQPSWIDFEEFYKDMGECPVGLELERKDSTGDYTASNCVWSDENTQACNRSRFKNNTTGKSGVTFDKARSKWRASLDSKKVHYEGGLHSTYEDAVKAREKLEIGVLGKLKGY